MTLLQRLRVIEKNSDKSLGDLVSQLRNGRRYGQYFANFNWKGQGMVQINLTGHAMRVAVCGMSMDAKDDIYKALGKL